MLREFKARLRKGDNKGAWTYVVMDGSAEFTITIDSEIRVEVAGKPPKAEQVPPKGEEPRNKPAPGKSEPPAPSAPSPSENAPSEQP